jgi:hypothetical protein
MLEAVSVSDVINFRLEQVIIPRWLCSVVVVCAACTMDYYFFVVRMLGRD